MSKTAARTPMATGAAVGLALFGVAVWGLTPGGDTPDDANARRDCETSGGTFIQIAVSPTVTVTSSVNRMSPRGVVTTVAHPHTVRAGANDVVTDCMERATDARYRIFLTWDYVAEKGSVAIRVWRNGSEVEDWPLVLVAATEVGGSADRLTDWIQADL